MMNATPETQKELRDLVRRAATGSALVFSRFLAPDTRALLLSYADQESLFTLVDGGFTPCERAVVGLDAYEDPNPRKSPVTLLSVRWDNRFGSLRHSDLLGALLGLGVQREALGDLRIGEGLACVACLATVAGFIQDGLTSAGRTPVRVSPMEGEPPPPEKGLVSTLNVPQPRIDALIQQALHLSREKAQSLIQAGLCQLNWQQELRGDRLAKEGDTLSLRGYGRVKVLALRGESRKGRLFLQVETFLHK